MENILGVKGESLIHQYTTVQTEKYNPNKDGYYNSSLDVQQFVKVKYNENGIVNSYEYLNDPTVTGFKIFFDFHKSTGLLADETYTNSALAYLDRIGEIDRKELLKLFITLLSKVSMDSAWLFQEIDGLDEVFIAPMQGKIRKHELSIKTFETIDQKIQSLIMLYRQIIFDDSRGVFVLPENLRMFDCAVYVHDSRIFNEVSSLSLNFLRTVSRNNPEETFHQLFLLSKCEFNVLTSGKTYFANVSNGFTEYVSNNLDFTVKKVKIDGVFSNFSDSKFKNPVFEKYFNKQFMYVDTKVGTSGDNREDLLPNRKKSGDFNERYKNEMLNYVSQNSIVRDINNLYEDYKSQKESWMKDPTTNLVKLASSTTQSVLDRATRDLTKLYLGNVNGFGFDDIAMFARSGNPKAIANMKITTESTNVSIDNELRTHKSMGNIND